ncbi:MAG: PAS domain-containing protein [Candidatus Riflebacteria bacterium]|nr:PAS domain-containing protein [Candidatus Riflebacteria bacterium]
MEPIRCRAQRLTRDGRVLEVDIALADLGPELGWVEVITDLSSRVELGLRLEAAESRLARLLTFSPTVLYNLELRDGQAVPIWVSDNLERLTGYRPRDCLRAGWWEERVHPEDRERAVANTMELLSTGRMTYEYRFRLSNGEYRVMRDEMVLLRGADGVPAEVIGAWMDVTETRRADEQRRHLEAQLAAAQRMESIGRLASGVAHDFNNMLTVILTHAGFLQDDLPEGAPLREDARQISDAGQRAAALTQQLLAFSRKQTLCPRVMDLNESVRSMESMVRRLIGEDIELMTRLADKPGLVEADPSRMEQVLLNLVVNARDAMPDGGNLLIETGRYEAVCGPEPCPEGTTPGPHLRLSVTDTGVGMNDDVKSHVFEPFFTTKPPGKGTGLGLATVYGIVAQSRGHLTIESEVGQGTTFHVWLPASARPLVAEQAPGVGISTCGRGETILLVEDEDTVRRLLRRVLERDGYRVLEASNGGEALLLAEQSVDRIDLLLTDVIMPGMSGPVLARRLVQVLTGLKVVYTSGYTNDALEHHGLSGPSITLIQKPFETPGLLATVREVLDGRRSSGAG